MTMMKREPDSVWNRVREDRDVDDLIFGEEFSVYREQSQPVSYTHLAGPAHGVLPVRGRGV